MSVPTQFAGQAAMQKQDEEAFDLKQYSYTPREFTEEDVVIKVECCGICGSDLHTITCGWMEHKNFPLIVGHEIVGKVVKAGKNTKHQVGDRIGFGAQCGSCMKCENCKNHNENYCVGGMTGTYNGATGSDVQPYTQGGYADYYQGPGHFAVKIPDGIESIVAAPMLCAGVTVFAPLKRYGAGPGKKVGVIGIGGLGHLAIQFANALGAETYAISHSDKKKADAEAMGAKGFVSSGDKESTNSHNSFFDLIICTSYQEGMPLQEVYLPLLKPFGNMVVVGLPNSGVPAGGWALLGKSITGSLIGSPKELEEMFDVAVKHNVKTWVETRPMSEATQAVQDMHHGKARYRYVLTN
ncbi:hypothetical protein IAR55_002835 [Kwoniella newhampshirensis]|uniref:Enoyl reductase (ER) domain-containing protein n=1 Tax=Kwoniella newhampshirensis TaxID=1651941 RepID=A0AAW0Z064_9TREE